MCNRKIVYLDVSTGDVSKARVLVAARYPHLQLVELSHRELRDGGWKGQIKFFRSLQGQTLVFYFNSLADCKQKELIPWLGMLHRCRETAIVDCTADWRIYRRRDWAWIFPKTLFALLADIAVFLFWLLYLKLWSLRPAPQRKPSRSESSVAYLFPFPLNSVLAGGAASHIRGVLSGLAANQSPCRIFSGADLPADAYPVELIPVRRKLSVFWESTMLSYNLFFARSVQRKLKTERPSVLYQRHGRFCVAGAILSRRIKVPLVLEYNGSEVWMAGYWDPARFHTWLRLCEEVVLKAASLIVVVSDPSKNELLARGVPAERVLVNPNAVDPEYFHPGCGGEQVRKDLGLSPQETVVEFVGTFSQWHGIGVLQEGIARLLQKPQLHNLTFLLVGQGPLHDEMRAFLRSEEASGKVIFTGLVPHDRVRNYLDAADILVSPHVPMPDGSPFFGSPTKLFEYMAMGKAIVASNLDQIAKVLNHGATAILSKPGDVHQFVEAVELLANDPHLRDVLGKRARAVAIEKHTWVRNTENVLVVFAGRHPYVPVVLSKTVEAASGHD